VYTPESVKTEQKLWRAEKGWSTLSDQHLQDKAQLVLAFGSRTVLSDPKRFNELRASYPKAHILCSSTSGEIAGSKVFDNTIIATALFFERTLVRVAQAAIASMKASYEKGEQLSKELRQEDLTHLFVLSDGHLVNGSELVKGLSDSLDKS